MDTIKMRIESALTKKQAAQAIVQLIKDACLGSSMPQTVGINYDGNIDYWYNVYGLSDCIVSVWDQENDNLTDMFDLDDADTWRTTGFFEGVVEFFAGFIGEAIEMAGEDQNEEIDIIWAK